MFAWVNLFRALHGVVVESDRSPQDTGRASERPGVTVERFLRRVEDHTAIHDREYAVDTRFHPRVPQLEMPAVLLFPILVQVEQQIESTLEVVG
jgi:hypothetical protein